jgi:hypothetical protein
MFFMVHPYCYEARASEPKFSAKYGEYIEYEKRVSERWRSAIAAMNPDEALVVASPGCSEGFEELVSTQLGPRGLVVKDVLAQPSESGADLLSPGVVEGLGRDLLRKFWRDGFSWTSDPLVQPVIARGWAERITREFEDRGLDFDPLTVEAEGWGESFEGCVANYTRYLGSYLRLGNPIEVNFNMTVPDAPYLLNASLLERIPLDHSIRLYLWETDDGRSVAWFHKALAKVGDPPLVARFPHGEMQVQVWGRGHLVWPATESDIGWEDGHLAVPVGTADFILANGVDPHEFRTTMTEATILEAGARVR